jgi:hypothetical protein
MNKMSRILLPWMFLDSFWKHLWHLAGHCPEKSCLRESDRIFRWQSVSFPSFGVRTISIAYLLFWNDDITIQHSSLMVLFLVCRQSFAQQRNERRWNVGQRIWTTHPLIIQSVLERQLAPSECCILPIASTEGPFTFTSFVVWKRNLNQLPWRTETP